MGKIASNYADKIYLTDVIQDMRIKKIRGDIKKGINNKIIIEISDRSKAISKAIKNLNSGEILLIAGKGAKKHKI